MEHDSAAVIAETSAGGGGGGEQESLQAELEKLETEKRKLEKRLQETKEVLVCRVCLDRPVAAVFMPCAHLSTCVTCSTSLTTCPLCRSPIHYAANVIL
ncbi:baculoviral IAP repeat-containing protein 8-like [Eriocheir sinensis]|uniref:baculoviral IAP repeat-containing protein 8-like n=1 Tax=Eriocheir sinensis TaxID=95602 RepID=UPI0021CAC6B6|nr:baculoviral IAP repeat-containing protein 8-like [Eriocheir sinensis]